MQLDKRLSQLLLICLLIAVKASAQNDTKLTLPATPAFSILDFEPAAVLRPTNNKDLGMDILNSFDANGKLKPNLGLEVTPYWLKNRPALKESDYLKPSLTQAFIQSLNFSAATVTNDVNGSNKLGVGLRFKVLSGEPLDEFEKKKRQLQVQETLISVITAARAQVGSALKSREDVIRFYTEILKEPNVKLDSAEIVEFVERANRTAVSYDDTPLEIRQWIDVLASETRDANDDLVKNVVALSKKRQGLVLEFAGASSFVTSDTNKSLERLGIWANASSYVTPTDVWAFTGRYMFANNDSALTNFDMGLSYIKEHANFNISLESMLRWYRADVPDFNLSNQPIQRVEKDFTYRLAMQASHRISNDISINLSLGKNFDSPFITGSGFFSILGLNYSFFSKQKVEIKETN